MPISYKKSWGKVDYQRAVQRKSSKAAIRYVNNILIMKFLTGISRNTQSKFCMLSLTECVRDFENYVLWGTH